MKFAIVASEKDIAGMNIFREIRENYPSLSHYLIKEDSIHADDIDKTLLKNYDFIIFASKHKGKQEKMLSVHAPGNWRQADFGGKEGQVCLTSSKILKIFLQELRNNIPVNWSDTMECTHHGPYIEKPCLFIEIGSNEFNWGEETAGKVIAKTIKNSIDRINSTNEKYIPAIGIGGLHYCQSFNKIQLNNKEIALSHIIPEYALPLTRGMLEEAIRKTLEKVSLILLDWKGIKGEQRQDIIKLIESLDLDWKKTSDMDK